jgi:small subunit ribosomal protein S1
MENVYLPEGQLISSPRNRELTASVEGLERAMSTGAILEGTALLCDAEFNLHIDFPALPHVKGIMPREETALARDGETVKDIAILTRVGKSVCFKVLRIEERAGETVAVLSRRAAQIECATHYLSALIPGDLVRARVTHLEGFGAFVDIGCGMPSLLSVDAISVSRISHPRDRVYNGQMIWAVVRHVDNTVGRYSGRIFLSTRELLGTWEENAARFTPGETVAGIVRSVEDYGVFVELAPNLAGLADLRDGVHDRAALASMVGRRAAVFIKSIIPERMKIKLVLIDAYKDDPIPTPKLTYFIDGETTSHIDRWVYSPANARKRIETVF